MKQYLELAKAVKEKGTYKGPAREGMPGTTSLFGYQFRHDLSEGFPILTTKKVSFKNIVYELLWFLRGDTNIKFLIDNGCNIWNEDAYNYYMKKCKQWKESGILKSLAYDHSKNPLSFDRFVEIVKGLPLDQLTITSDYILGDCGKQYGWLWRNWGAEADSNSAFTIDVKHLPENLPSDREEQSKLLRKIAKELGMLPVDFSNQKSSSVDQLKDVINLLKTNPLSRRIILSAWNPTTLNDMALNACHALVQFNCRPLTEEQKEAWRVHAPAALIYKTNPETGFTEINHDVVPQYYLDCQMYQRSADLFLGVPYNITSYALLTHILAKVCNMVPGDFIHTFGDVHIYDNHMDQINEQLTREPKKLPTLVCLERNEKGFLPDNLDKYFSGRYDLDDFIGSLDIREFKLKGYDPHPAIKGELSTGLK